MKTVIFDLDGTLADIETRREISIKENGNISLDTPNRPVITMAKLLKESGHRIVILSGRSKVTKDATRDWLKQFDVPFDVLKMRPDNKEFKFMPDDQLKKLWLDQLFPNTEDVLCVFDDRDKVVKMWRENGLSCLQVAEGNF